MRKKSLRNVGSITPKSAEKQEEIERRVEVVIKVSNLENVKYLKDQDGNSLELEIILDFMGSKIDGRRFFDSKQGDTEAASNITDNKNLSTIFQSVSDEKYFFEFKIQVNASDEEIFNIFANPVHVILRKCEDQIVIGHSNIDLYPLASQQPETRSQKLFFERESFCDAKCFHRKISFLAEISSDNALLNDQLANSLYITCSSITNLQPETDVEVIAGIMTPLMKQFSKSLIFTQNDSRVSGTCKRWFNLSHVPGKGAESPFKIENDNVKENLLDVDEIVINSIARVILTSESEIFLRQHIRSGLKIAIEVMIDQDHVIGLINPEELLHVGKKKIRAVLPLLKFNNQLMANECGYRSIFYKPKSILKIQKSRKSLKVSSMVSEVEAEEAVEIPYLNSFGDQVSVVVEFELEKSINEEVFEECHELVGTEFVSESTEIPNEMELFTELTKDFKMITRNILKIYDKENDIGKILAKIIKDGYFSQVEDFLLPGICELGQAELSEVDDFNDFKRRFLCELSSEILNKKKVPASKNQLITLTQIFDFLKMEEKSKEIFLTSIDQKNCEGNWISYAIYNVRHENFNKALVCIEEALSLAEFSLLGHILKTYINFKLKKFVECSRLINFMEYKHGDLLELSMIHYFIATQNSSSKAAVLNFNKNFRSHEDLEKIYEAPEILWHSTKSAETFLSWQDPFVKCAIFFTKIGCFDFAELLLSEYYGTHGVNVNYSYLLSVIDALKGNFRDAWIHLNKIAVDDVANHQVNYGIITSLKCLVAIKLEKYELAEKLFNQDSGEKNFLEIFMTAKRCNDAEKSLKLLKRAHELLPMEITFLELGKCNLKVKDLNSAEKCFQRAISHNPKSFQAWQQLAEIYMKQNRMSLVEMCIENSS